VWNLSAGGTKGAQRGVREDGLLAGYLECEDFAAARAATERTATLKLR
jgi:hypothetical protein